MKSMTGFGRANSKLPVSGVSFNVEVFSVNRKQLDIRLNIAKEISSFEPVIRKLINTKIARGSVNLKVFVQMSPQLLQKSYIINETLAGTYLKKCVSVVEKTDIKADINLSEIFRLPGVVEQLPPDLSLPEIENALKDVVNEALDNMIDMQEIEGVQLKKDIKKRLKILKQLVEDLTPLAKLVPELQKKRLLQRLNDAQLDINEHDDRLLKELVIFSDKSDVTEELTRLRSHFNQFELFLQKNNQVIGRSLDFLIQEILREITTLSNKALHPDITPFVVKFKTELEKIREQVQNIE